MKLILISDLHLLWENPIGRLDNLAETQLLKLSYILEYAQKNNALILQSGDFFNRPRLWHLLPQITRLLREYDVKIFSVFGQHDTYLYSHDTRGSTNLGELEAAGLVEILDNSVYILEHDDFQGMPVHLYGASHGVDFDPPNDPEAFNILVIHKSIGHKGNERGATSSAKAFLKKHKEFDLILCGDIHQRFEVKIGDRRIINTGAILRRTAREYNFTHRPMFYVWEMGPIEWKGKWIGIPHRPPEEVLSREHLEVIDDDDESLDEFTEGVNELQTSGTDVINILQSLIETKNPNPRVRQIIAEKINADRSRN